MYKQQRFYPAFYVLVILAAMAYGQQPSTASGTKNVDPPKQKAAPPKPAVAGNKAQPEAATTAKESAAELTPQQLRALSLAHEAGQEAFAIETKRDSALLQGRAAGLLWAHEREAARKFFDQAYETALAYYVESKDNNYQKVGRQSSVGRSDVRLEIIKLINQHDKGLGESYLNRLTEDKRREAEEKRKASASPPMGVDRLLGENSQQADDMVRIADELLAVDSATSQRLAMNSLNIGVSRNLAQYLANLSSKERAAADKLFLAALNSLQRSAQPTPGHVLVLSAYPFGEGIIRIVTGENSMGYGFGKPQNFTVSPQQVQQFLQTAFALLVRATPPTVMQQPQGKEIVESAFYTIKYLAPKVAEFAPAMLEEWNGLGVRLQSMNTDESRLSIENTLKREADRKNNPQAQNQDSLKSALERAEKTQDPEARDANFAEAAFMALEADDYEQALSIAGRIVDLALRSSTKSWINYNAAEEAKEKKQWDDARRYALEVSATDQRAYLLFTIAQAVLKAEDRPRAIELLQTAQHEAEAAENAPGKVRALIGIASTFAGFEPTRGFEVMEVAIKAANQLKEKANFDKDEARVTRNFETKSGSRMQVNTAQDFDLGRTLVALSRQDYERSLSLAQLLDYKPAKVAAVLSLAESVLNVKKN